MDYSYRANGSLGLQGQGQGWGLPPEDLQQYPPHMGMMAQPPHHMQVTEVIVMVVIMILVTVHGMQEVQPNQD